MRRHADFFWTIAATLIVIWAYRWTATEGLGHFGSPGGNDSLLNLQVEAFHAGHLHLKVAPDPRLLALPNPYDPQFNRGTRLLDASLYKGAYYTYFGPVPLLCLMWPWYAAAGVPIPADLAAFLFGSGAFLLQAAFLLYSKRAWFRGAPSLWLGFVVLMVGGGNLLQPMLRSHSTFDIPVLAGLLFTSASLLFAALGVSANKSVLWPWSLASLCFGLAVGCRPNLLLAGVPLMALFLFQEGRSGKARIFKRLWAAAAPGVLCVAAFLIYNFLRFGNPLEFGNHYTLVEVDWRHRAAFSVRYALANFFYYVLSLPRLSAFFPYFVESAPLPFAPPAGYLSYIDRVAGLVPAFPFALLGLGCLAKGWRGTAGSGGRPLAALLGAWAACVGIPLLLFIGPSLRYESELAGPLFLLGGLFALGAWTWLPRGVAVILCAATAWLGIWSAASNFLIGSATYGYFKAVDPTEFRTVSAAVNDLSYPLERALGWRPMIPSLTLRFPIDKIGRVEPLWVAGKVPESDFLYVYYATPTTWSLDLRRWA